MNWLMDNLGWVFITAFLCMIIGIVVGISTYKQKEDESDGPITKRRNQLKHTSESSRGQGTRFLRQKPGGRRSRKR